MIKELNKISERYNSAMNSDDAFIVHSDDLIKELSAIVEKFPSEFSPLLLLRTITCKSRNQTEHINILNKMIKMNNDDHYKETLVDCKKQPGNECKVWDNDKPKLSLGNLELDKI